MLFHFLSDWDEIVVCVLAVWKICDSTQHSVIRLYNNPMSPSLLLRVGYTSTPILKGRTRRRLTARGSDLVRLPLPSLAEGSSCRLAARPHRSGSHSLWPLADADCQALGPFFPRLPPLPPLPLFEPACFAAAFRLLLLCPGVPCLHSVAGCPGVPQLLQAWMRSALGHV